VRIFHSKNQKLIFYSNQFFLNKKKIYLRSDNAGCYHNQTLVLGLKFLCDKHNHNAMRYDFCEAQTGKDVCDRKIATFRRSINQHIDNNNDILFAADIKKAIDLNQHINSGARTYVCETNDTLNFKDMFKFPNVTTYHSFQYLDSTSLTYFKHYNVGNGETKSIASFIAKGFNLNSVKKAFECAKLDIIEDDQQEKKASSEKEKAQPMKTFLCSIEKCSQIFFEEKDLDKHKDEHNSIKNISQLDRISLKYFSIINNVRSKNVDSNNNFKVDNLENIQNRNELSKGFAQKKRKKSNLNPKNSTYLLELFKKGINNSQKACPEGVRLEMIQKFGSKESLPVDVIRSYFNRMNTLNNSGKLFEFEKRLKKRFEKHENRIQTGAVDLDNEEIDIEDENYEEIDSNDTIFEEIDIAVNENDLQRSKRVRVQRVILDLDD